MPALTETRAPCAGTDMTPIGPTDVQRSQDARILIEAYCQACPGPEKVRCHNLREDAPGIWGGRYYPPRKGQTL